MTDITAALEQAFLQKFPSEAGHLLEDESLTSLLNIIDGRPTAHVVTLLSGMSREGARRLLLAMPAVQAQAVLGEMDIRDIAELLVGMSEEASTRMQQQLGKADQRAVTELMSYAHDSAGQLMDPRYITFDPEMNVADALERLRRQGRNSHERNNVYVADVDRRPVAKVSIVDLALASPDEKIKSLMRPLTAIAQVTDSREDIVKQMDRFHLVTIPVVDFEGQLRGVIRYNSLVSAAVEIASLDIQTMVGVSKDERALSKVSFAVSKRLPWLQINLLTAFLAAAVVGLFESTIAQNTALAVLLPVVAGQSGNTGAQALAVTMRGLALREIHTGHWLRIIFKEANVGFINSLAVALVTALGVYFWSGSSGLSMIIGVSMIMSMVIAGISGAAIPIMLQRLGMDPAASSSIILTTVTDIAGFFSFLGIATLMMSRL